MERKNVYTLGLDIGTNSVGWAVVDQNHNLAKALGHYMRGVRMFKDSEDAKARRTFRNSRRRLARRKERICLLQNIFSEEINKIDPNFFIRLNESFYQIEDKRIKSNLIFDNFLSNKEYNRKYPTIWHLRNELVNATDKKDIRLVYLAIHHIVKYRGNFLYDGEYNMNDETIVKNSLEDFINCVNALDEQINNENNYDGGENYSSYLHCKTIDESNLDEIIKNLNIIITDNKYKELNNKTKNDKKNNLISYLNGKNNIYSEVLPMFLISGSIDVKKIKIVKDNKSYEEIKDFKIDVNSEEFESKIDEASSTFKEISDIILEFKKLKDISDYYFVKKFIGNSKCVSEAFLNSYKDHKNDLKKLKTFYKKYLSDKYNLMFKEYDEKIANYASYVGSNSFDSGKTKEHFKHCSQDEFYKYVKKDLESINNEEAKDETKYFLEKIDNGTFLLRSNSPKNGAIPHQLHFDELAKILNNQNKYYPFLNEISDDLSNIEKIYKIFNFKRPYYVGPLKGNSEFNWATLKDEKNKITPWNFSEKVNLSESAITFINRMQNKCTYLNGENDFCLPKASIYFQAYNVLSYINKIKINGELIPVNIKQKIFKEKFMKCKNVSAKDILKFLHTNFNIKEDEVTIDTCNVKFSSFISFKDQLFNGNVENTYKNINMIENVIKDLTIFNDKDILRNRFKNEYKLNEEQIKIIFSFNYKGFGRLSYNLLNTIEISNITNEGEVIKTLNGILPWMWCTNLNLEELLNSTNYNLKEQISIYNNENSKIDLNEKDDNFILNWLDEYTIISPMWVRPFIQSYRIIKDVREILQSRGEDISYYSIECTRTNKEEKNKKIKSRSQTIEEIFNNSKEIEKDYNILKLKEKLIKEGDKVNLMDKLYLYFTQLGKDIYSLEDIDINDLDNYDIDHIYPQSWIKDNSLSNRVLTKGEYNRKKSDTPLPELREKGVDFLNKNYFAYYNLLLEKGLISKAKFNRLTEKSINSAVLDNFINRQKTATDQATKSVIELLKYLLTKEHIDEFKGDEKEISNQLNDYLNKHIIYSKAENVSDFRQINNIYKSRTANNYHHAHDAYLNAILGKVLKDYYDDKGIYHFKDYINKKDNKDNTYSTLPLKILNEYPKYNKKGELLWGGKEEIHKIYKTIAKNFDIRETRLTTKGNEFLSKVTILPKGEGTVDVKSITPNGNLYDRSKYGGYDSSSYNYYSILKCINKKDEEEYKLVPINKIIEKDIISYFKKDESFKKYKDVFLELKEIRIGTVLQVNDTLSNITGCSSGNFMLQNYIDRNFSMNSIKLIHDIDKINEIILYEEKNKYLSDLNKSRIKYINNMNNSEIYLNYRKPDLTKNDFKYYKLVLNNNDLEILYSEIKTLWDKDLFKFENISKILSKIDSKLFDNIPDRSSLISAVKALTEMLLLLKTNERKYADLSYFKLAKNAGKLSFCGTFKKGMRLLSYSPTGLRSKILFEVK